jgi:hypothetical protein
MPYKDPTKRREMARVSAAKCRQERPHLQKKNRIKHEYGLSWEEYLGILQSQAYACAVCGKDLTEVTGCVDHDHATGAVRGILCGPCNTGLGHFYDDPQRLENAAAYLRRP